MDEVIAACRAEGFRVDIDIRLDTFARLHLTDPAHPDQHRVELVANWRAQPPVQMGIGPVLHPDDVMAAKMDAHYNRAAGPSPSMSGRAEHARDVGSDGWAGRVQDRLRFRCSGVLGEAEVHSTVGRVQPPAGDHLGSDEEVHPFRPVRVCITEQ